MSDLEQKRRQVRQRLIDENEFPNIPENWCVERLRFLFTESKERNGKSPVGDMLSVSEYRGVVPREYEHEEQKRTDEELDNYRVVRPGQLAVNSMWLNHLGLGVSEHTGHVSPAYNVYEISDRLDRRFVHHLVRSNYYLKIYMRYLYGIRPNSFQIKSNDWASIPIIVPDLATQRQIADFLDRETARIDLLIEKKQRFIQTLSESRLTAAPTVIRSHGGPSMKETPDTFDILFDADSWSIGRVKHVVKLMTSGSRGWSDLIADDGELFLQSGNIGRRNEVVLNDAKRIVPQTNAEARRTRLKDADTLVCITGGRTGAVGFLETVPETAYVNQHICLIRPNRNKLLPKLLSQILYSEIGQRQFSFFQYGLKQGLGFSQVGEVRIPIPPKNLQQKVSAEIDRVFERVGKSQSLQEASIDRLKEYRSALITAAVTGQIDVKTYAKSGTPDRRLEGIQEEMGA